MHRLIGDVSGVGEVVGAFGSGLSEVLLLVHDEVLGTSNNTRVLNTLDSFCNCYTSEYWIRAEA